MPNGHYTHSIRAFLTSLTLALAACTPKPDNALLGTLEWDRIALPAEAAEPIVEVAVAEGDAVGAGQLLLQLDTRRLDAELRGAEAEATRLASVLAESIAGPRAEAIAESRARLARANAAFDDATAVLVRVQMLRKGGASSVSELDRAQAGSNAARADVAATRAALAALLNGTRPEQLAQAEAASMAASARVELLRLRKERLSVRAPRAGRVEVLPFKLGDQPATGATLVGLLVGDAPYARVYVPQTQRAERRIGERFRVQIEGIPQTFSAELRAIRSEASFTPYFALTGDDVSRLSYLAELVLLGPQAASLPAGLPLRAEVELGGTP